MFRENLLAQYLTSNQALFKIWKDKFFKAVADEKLTPSLISVLFTVEELQPVTSGVIAEKLKVTKGAVTQFIESLVHMGYIVRQSNEQDRRIFVITLTKSGVGKLTVLKKNRTKLVAQLTNSLSDDEIRQAIEINEKILKALD